MMQQRKKRKPSRKKWQFPTSPRPDPVGSWKSWMPIPPVHHRRKHRLCRPAKLRVLLPARSARTLPIKMKMAKSSNPPARPPVEAQGYVLRHGQLSPLFATLYHSVAPREPSSSSFSGQRPRSSLWPPAKIHDRTRAHLYFRNTP